MQLLCQNIAELLLKKEKTRVKNSNKREALKIKGLLAYEIKKAQGFKNIKYKMKVEEGTLKNSQMIQKRIT